MISLTGLLWGEHIKVVCPIVTPVLFGEVAFMLWLLIVGARVRPLAVVAPQSS